MICVWSGDLDGSSTKKCELRSCEGMQTLSGITSTCHNQRNRIKTRDNSSIGSGWANTSGARQSINRMTGNGSVGENVYFLGKQSIIWSLDCRRELTLPSYLVQILWGLFHNCEREVTASNAKIIPIQRQREFCPAGVQQTSLPNFASKDTFISIFWIFGSPLNWM